jgi:ribosomal protein S18 acetylase RimI-like enzyme
MPHAPIRPAAEGDIDLLRSLAAAIWREYYPAIISPAQVEYMLDLMYSAEVIRAEMARGVTWELVTAASVPEAGRTGGDAVGYLSFSLDPGARSVTLHKLYLLPRLHGRGIGRQMLDHVREATRVLGAQVVRLTVNRRNTRAIRAYERTGFRIAGAIVSDIGGGFVMDDYVMELDLTPDRRDAPPPTIRRNS